MPQSFENNLTVEANMSNGKLMLLVSAASVTSVLLVAAITLATYS